MYSPPLLALALLSASALGYEVLLLRLLSIIQWHHFAYMMISVALLGYGAAGTALLVEALLDRGTEGDVAEAQSAIDRAANLPADKGLVLRDITLLRLRALLARARGDDVAYRDLADRYRAMAESLGFEGHIAMADSMT